MNIKRFDTYRGVAVDKNGTKGDVAVGLVDVSMYGSQMRALKLMSCISG